MAAAPSSFASPTTPVRRRTWRRGLGAAGAALLMAITGTSTASAAPLDIYTDLTSPSPNFYLQFLDDFVPQGIAYSSSKSLFYVTHYNYKNESTDSRIAIYDSAGNYKRYVKIAEGHVGGIAVWNDWLYVLNSKDGMGRLRRYSLNQISNPANAGQYVSTISTEDTYTGASSFASIYDGRIYFGTWSNDPNWRTAGKMWSWALSSSTGAHISAPYENVAASIPANVQGYVRTADYEIFSTSRDRDCRSRFIVKRRSDGTTRRIYGPAMSEGMVNAAGKLFINFESASTVYSGSALDVTKRVAVGSTTSFASGVLSRGFAASSDDGCQG